MRRYVVTRAYTAVASWHNIEADSEDQAVALIAAGTIDRDPDTTDSRDEIIEAEPEEGTHSESTPVVAIVVGAGTIQEVASQGGRVGCRIIDLDTDTGVPHVVDWLVTDVPDIAAFTRLWFEKKMSE